VFQAALLLGVRGFVIIEGIRRLFEPPHIAGSTMLWFGIIDLAGNAIGLIVLASGRNHNFNMKAFLGVVAPRHSSWRWAAKSGGTSVFRLRRDAPGRRQGWHLHRSRCPVLCLD
jgi:hypothetical protein